MVVIISLLLVIIIYVTRSLPFLDQIYVIFNILDLGIDNKLDANMATMTRLGAFIFIPAYIFSFYMSIKMRKYVIITNNKEIITTNLEIGRASCRERV